VLSSEDVDGDSIADAVVAVRAECRPTEESWLLVVALHRPDGWTLQVVAEERDLDAQYARVLILGAERFVYYSLVRMADENMGQLNFYQVRPGAPLEPVAPAEYADGTRGIRRVTVGRDGRVTIPCQEGRCEPSWNAVTRRMDIVPVRRSVRRRPSH